MNNPVRTTPPESLFCPICELSCDKLVTDAPGTSQESEMCEPCHRCTEVLAADVRYLVDPKYNLLGLGETSVAYMRRMHEVLL